MSGPFYFNPGRAPLAWPGRGGLPLLQSTHPDVNIAIRTVHIPSMSLLIHLLLQLRLCIWYQGCLHQQGLPARRRAVPLQFWAHSKSMLRHPCTPMLHVMVQVIEFSHKIRCPGR